MAVALEVNSVLLLAFGGPGSPEEIRPFLGCVLRGHPVPPERVEEVVRHYEAVGGKSPLVEITHRQARALEKALGERGLRLPVYVGLRHSSPFIRDVLDRMAADGARRALGFILSTHQSDASWERYKKGVAEARSVLVSSPAVEFCPGWHTHPLLIQAFAELIQPEFEKIDPQKRPSTPLLFTAHSIPSAMAARSSYTVQVRETAKLVAERLGHRSWSIAYQSRSGGPDESWLEPDIGNCLRDLADSGANEVVVAAIGFVCDHVEVLYDLDIEARSIAEGLGMRFLRVSSLNDHPTFIRMMAEVVEAKLSTLSNQPKKGENHSC